LKATAAPAIRNHTFEDKLEHDRVTCQLHLSRAVSTGVFSRLELPYDSDRLIAFEPCWSGEVVSVAFAIDCHDRSCDRSFSEEL
jgi:hypothetical protein